MGIPQNEWFWMENPIKIDDLRVPLILGNLQMVNTGATALSNHTMPSPQSPLRHLAKWISVVHPNRYLVVNIKIAVCYGYSMSLHNIHLPNLKKNMKILAHTQTMNVLTPPTLSRWRVALRSHWNHRTTASSCLHFQAGQQQHQLPPVKCSKARGWHDFPRPAWRHGIRWLWPRAHTWLHRSQRASNVLRRWGANSRVSGRDGPPVWSVSTCRWHSLESAWRRLATTPQGPNFGSYTCPESQFHVL